MRAVQVEEYNKKLISAKLVEIEETMKNKVTIDKKIIDTYPQIRLGLMHFHADVKEPEEKFWLYMDNDVLPRVRDRIKDKEWGEISGIKGSRSAYKIFGRNPSRYRVSSEALLRRVKRGDELYHINSVVDVNNLISVESGLSVGSYDLDNIHGSITLRKAEQGEGYKGIGKDFIDMENMLVLADDEGIFGSSMSDSTRAMVSKNTKDILLVIYCFEEEINLENLLDSARQWFEQFAYVTDCDSWIV